MTTITLNKKQEEGLKTAVERFQNGEKYTCIAGYAGSGKSTLIPFIIAALGIEEEKVCYVAFTGKAATVLKQKGCQNAITAHKLLYHAKPLPNGDYIYTPRKKFEIEYKVVVVDEISMLPKSMWELLCSHSCYIIACGDPGQLPPISKDEDNHVLDTPHIFLDEIMRQAQESEIIRLSMHIREGKPISTFNSLGEQVQIFQPKDVVSGMYTWADQIICATNEKRNYINRFMREQKGYAEEPCIGDKIISLRNHWDDYSFWGEWALTNGTIGTISEFKLQEVYVPKYIADNRINFMFTEIDLENGDSFTNIPIDYECLKTGQSTLNSRQQYQMNKNKMIPDAPYEFAYAYAITCWKAQGSEWDKILGIEEAFPFDKDTRQKYMYTLCTRAKEKLVLITK